MNFRTLPLIIFLLSFASAQCLLGKEQDTPGEKQAMVQIKKGMITSQIADVSDEKTTRLGTGHFVTTKDIFRNQTSEVVGTHSFTLFMYRPSGDNGS